MGGMRIGEGHHHFFLPACTGMLALALIGCGSSSSGGVSTPTGDITLSGQVTFTNYAISPDAGILYDSSFTDPIRGAWIEVRNSNGATIATTQSDEDGDYSAVVPGSQTVTVVIKAAMGGTNAAPTFQIVDNTANQALYTLQSSVGLGAGNTTHNINADSGWGGSSYTGERQAAPFAMLDVVYQAVDVITDVDNSVNFTPLKINWSPNNIPSSGNIAAGRIGTSYYDPSLKELFILGAEDIDTDEYDAPVMAHEWTHYFEDNIGRTDSIGGAHSINDFLDPTVSWSEGFATALGNIVGQSPWYIDTAGNQQGLTAIANNIEQDNVNDNARHTSGFLFDGHYSEQSIMELVWDLYDGGAGDDDNIALGLAPIYRTITGSFRDSPSFATVYPFLHHLKADNPVFSSAIDDVAAAENVITGGEFDSGSIVDDFYNVITGDGVWVDTDLDDDPLATWQLFPNTFAGNKWWQRQFFRNSGTESGLYRLTVSVDSPSLHGIYFHFTAQTAREDNLDSAFAITGLGVDAEYTLSFTPGEILSWAVRLHNNNNFVSGGFNVRLEPLAGPLPAPKQDG